jgi:hypothetical protein
VSLREQMKIEDREREERLAEDIKYYAARHVWRNRDGRTTRQVPWPVWFRKKFGEDFNEYVQRKMAEKKA